MELITQEERAMQAEEAVVEIASKLERDAEDHQARQALYEDKCKRLRMALAEKDEEAHGDVLNLRGVMKEREERCVELECMLSEEK